MLNDSTLGYLKALTKKKKDNKAKQNETKQTERDNTTTLLLSFSRSTPNQSLSRYWERERRPNEGDAGGVLGR
jgi:hypothetical protein